VTRVNRSHSGDPSQSESFAGGPVAVVSLPTGAAPREQPKETAAAWRSRTAIATARPKARDREGERTEGGEREMGRGGGGPAPFVGWSMLVMIPSCYVSVAAVRGQGSCCGTASAPQPSQSRAPDGYCAVAAAAGRARRALRQGMDERR
jgi:hypothetical protein